METLGVTNPSLPNVFVRDEGLKILDKGFHHDVKIRNASIVVIDRRRNMVRKNSRAIIVDLGEFCGRFFLVDIIMGKGLVKLRRWVAFIFSKNLIYRFSDLPPSIIFLLPLLYDVQVVGPPLADH